MMIVMMMIIIKTKIVITAACHAGSASRRACLNSLNQTRIIFLVHGSAHSLISSSRTLLNCTMHLQNAVEVHPSETSGLWHYHHHHSHVPVLARRSSYYKQVHWELVSLPFRLQAEQLITVIRGSLSNLRVHNRLAYIVRKYMSK